ncbi:MAG: hypothetical protein NWQ54_02215 [Paraglaciecola sp.]|uniref:HzsA-related protein n=1 Tax=Paraglaciecola sp. TaxID=1920173 RepID=UPI00273E01CF|nr:hypothetical protein [Paraglaciecola sp.]MDP5030591.1 hypothetical protein [Paraglaciecola sp.]MDP5129668.1 hypothetical protein [Paraglaciecola sp.]
MFHAYPTYIKILLSCLLINSILGCGGDKVLPNDQAPDPVVVDVPLAFIKRNLPLDANGEIVSQDLRRLNDFVPGAALYIKARASATAVERNITDRAFFSAQEIADATPDNPLAAYDVKDLEVSYDGQTLLFAMRAPEIEGADEDEQATWNLWQYHLESDILERVISNDALAEEGQDTAPVYLADGRIVFSSTRQQANQAILLDENKPQYQALDERRNQTASVLHVINPDGSDIKQISFNQSHDLDPTVLSSGKILFSRWDNAGNNNSVNIYQMNADGSELELMYGRHSHVSERSTQALQYSQLRELPSGNILSALRPVVNEHWGGDFVEINIQQFIDRQTPLTGQSGNGSAEQVVLFDNIVIDGALSAGGRFSAVYPLWDGSDRILFSWSQCRVYDPEASVDEGEPRPILPCTPALLATPDIQAAPLLYGLWMYDPIDNTQLVVAVPQEQQMYSEVLAMQARAFPGNAQQSADFDAALAVADLAQVHIRSVYDFAGVDNSPQGLAVLADPTQTAVAQRPARFLRVVKAVSQPDDSTRDISNSAFGRSTGQLMREIIGYVPVEPDGSVLMTLPANVPVAFSILDGDGKRVSERHQNWLQFAPGEVRSCNGCHTQASTAAHGRFDAEASSINQGAASTGLPFPNTNPALFAELGETMAQTAGRMNGLSYPNADIEFSDIWNDPATQAPAAGFTMAYGDLTTPLPITPSCATNWTALCRIQINYPEHIQPLFDAERPVLAEDGVSELNNHRCTSCHAPVDAAELAQVPAAQLDLSSSTSTENPDQFTSYRELMFTDNEQEIIEGLLLERLVEVSDANGDTVFERDEDGELILDEVGQPIALLTTVAVSNTMSVNGAHASADFFLPFNASGSHYTWLSPVELKLIAEWLDIGGQYYNNPFAAPVN